MRFDYTHGNGAKYIVTLYGCNVEDHYYLDTYKDAKRLFERIKGGKHEKGTALSLSDIVKDHRKEFYKF